MIRVLIADDQTLVRQGLRALLSRTDDIQIVGEAHDGQQAVDMSRDLAPDVILMDVRMPRLNGIDATQQILALPKPPRVLMVAMQSDANTVRQAVQNGAKGFVTKTEMFTELPAAIRALSKDECYYGASIASLLPP